ncbi:LOW QUALITY PROTEIN: hypothetical protein Ct61P_02769 [Colletotrichum tofieldiae]|nr:LOW QUALITY PROTEIN: hypothetical protein Ct61P_02769 [Colletotrichum tofieldiae]
MPGGFAVRMRALVGVALGLPRRADPGLLGERVARRLRGPFFSAEERQLPCNVRAVVLSVMPEGYRAIEHEKPAAKPMYLLTHAGWVLWPVPGKHPESGRSYRAVDAGGRSASRPAQVHD